MKQPRKVTLSISFTADMAEGMEGDQQADRIGDDVIEALNRQQIIDVYEGSFSVEDWNDEAVTE